MREAVEHLKTIPDTGYTGLQASVSVEVGMYKLLAQPIIPLSQILGKKPSEVWEMFDKKVDESIASHDRRWNGTFKL